MLTPPWEESTGEADERKQAKYQELVEDCGAASCRGSYKVGFGIRGLIYGLVSRCVINLGWVAWPRAS